jgi:hypothetical protein
MILDVEPATTLGPFGLIDPGIELGERAPPLGCR